MSISMYNLIQTMAKAQFAQDLYAVFQGTDSAQRERRVKHAMDEARAAQEKIGEVKKITHSDEILVNSEGHGGHGNFSEFFDLVKKRFEEHKKSREAHPDDDPESSGKVIDFIA
jgi:hypothetical protein